MHADRQKTVFIRVDVLVGSQQSGASGRLFRVADFADQVSTGVHSNQSAACGWFPSGRNVGS